MSPTAAGRGHGNSKLATLPKYIINFQTEEIKNGAKSSMSGYFRETTNHEFMKEQYSEESKIAKTQANNVYNRVRKRSYHVSSTFCANYITDIYFL